jgi:ankyrin repeat protein
MSKLIDAVKNNDLVEVQRLLAEEYRVPSRNYNIDESDATGRTALSWAATNDSVAIMEVLIKAGAKVDEGDKDGSTPLYFAAVDNCMRAIQVLLRAGAIVDQPDKNGVTPLYGAACHGKVDAVQTLLHAGAKPYKEEKTTGVTPLYIAVQEGNLETVQALIIGGADVNQATNNGSTPLYKAITKGHEEVVRALIIGGADVNQATNKGFAPIHPAAQLGHVGIIMLLKHAGAKVDVCSSNITRPITLAAEHGHAEAVKTLLSYYSPAFVIESKYFLSTLLRVADLHKHKDILELLKSYKRKPDGYYRLWSAEVETAKKQLLERIDKILLINKLKIVKRNQELKNQEIGSLEQTTPLDNSVTLSTATSASSLPLRSSASSSTSASSVPLRSSASDSSLPLRSSTSSSTTTSTDASYLPRVQFLNDYVIASFNAPPGSNFYHSISRDAAEALLKTCNSGAFLFRPSSEPNGSALSYKKGQEIIHISFQILNDGTISDSKGARTMAKYFQPCSDFLTHPVAVENSLNPALQRSTSQNNTTGATSRTSSANSIFSATTSQSNELVAKQTQMKQLQTAQPTQAALQFLPPPQFLAVPASLSQRPPSPSAQSSSARIAAGLTLQDYHQAIARIAEQERQTFLGLLQTDYQRLFADYQRLGQQGFESNYQLQQQRFAQYLASQQQKLQGQATQQQTQFSQVLQDALAQHQGRALTSLSDGALQELQIKLREKLGAGFTSAMENLLNGQQYQQEIQRLQQGILQRVQERQGQMAMEMIHVQQKQQQIKNEHDPLFQQYQQQQQTLIEQNELQKHEAVRVFYNTIEKVLGSRLMSAMSLASGMMVRETTKSETAVAMGANLAGKIVDLIPVIGPVANAVIGAGLSVAQTVHGKYVDKKQETKFKNTLDSMIRLEDAMALAELVARRLAQSYQQHITENYLSAEETEAAGENAANIVYGCIKAGGLKPLATKTLDEKVTHLVSVVQAEAQKQKGTFFRKAAVFKEPVAAQISSATRKQVHALGEDLTKVQEQNELAAKQAQMKLQQVEKEQAEMRVQMQKLQAAQATPQFLPPPPSPQFLAVPASPSQRPPSPMARSSSPSFFNAAPAASTPVTFSLLSEDAWPAAIEQLKQNTSKTIVNLQIQRTEKKLTLSTVNRFPTKEKDFEVLGEAIKKMFPGDVEDWEVDNGVLTITAEASQKAKKLEVFLGQAFAAKIPTSAPMPVPRSRFAKSE